MRDVLFRGKRVELSGDKGGWIEGSLTFSWYDGYIPLYHIGSEFECELVYDDSVGQYIGTDDKNGVKIFEGDIVEVIRSSDEGDWSTRFVVEDIRRIPSELYGSSVVGLEVLGNIHDNPELLDAKGK